MSTPIINAQMDAINGSMATLKGDLATLRPLIKTIKENALNAYATESLSNQSVASFTDGAKNIPVKSLSVAITPTQNLNGQTSPYPAGGGKNKFGGEYGTSTKYPVPAGATAVAISGKSAGTYALNIRFYDANNTSITTVAVASVGQTTFSTHMSVPTNADTFILYSPNSGDTTTFSQVQVEAGDAPTAYAPYSNICPISGHTEVKVVRTGKNLIWRDNASNIYNGGHLIPVTSGETLYFYGEWTGGSLIPRIYSDPNETNKTNQIASLTALSTTASGSVATRVMSTDGFLGVAYNGSVSSYTVGKLMVSRTPITSADDYEASQNTTYTIDLDGTRYGGTLDVTTGVLTVTHERLNMGSFTYGYNAPYFYTSVTTKAAGNFNIMADAYKTATQGSASLMGNNEIKGNATTYTIYVTDSRYTDPAAFKTAVNGIYMVFELATPTTVQLTPTEVTTLLGQNNIWADTGDITEITIRCDTALYIQKLVG